MGLIHREFPIGGNLFWVQLLAEFIVEIGKHCV